MEKLTPQELLARANVISRKRVTRASLVKIIRENEEKEKAMSLVSGTVHVQSRVSGYDAGVASDWNWDFHGSLEKCTQYVEEQVAEDKLYGLEDESEYRIIDDSDEVLLEWKNGRLVR